MKPHKKTLDSNLDRLLGLFKEPSSDQLDLSRERIQRRLDAAGHQWVRGVTPQGTPRRLTWKILTAAALFALALSVVLWPGGSAAVVETADSGLHRVVEGKVQRLRIGEKVGMGETIRSDGASSATLTFNDGSRVEMRSKSELALEDASDRLRIQLNGGSVIVSGSREPKKNLYVQTRDATVSVVDTVSLVTVEEAGSRVAVIQGEARVEQKGRSKKLRPGEQVATNPSMESHPMAEEISWSRSAGSHLAMLQQSEALNPLPARIEFEVASIKPTKSPNGAMGGCHGSDLPYKTNDNRSLVPIGRCVITGARLTHIMAMAYKIDVNKIDGRPDWESGPRFDVEAKAESSSATQQQLLEMLQALLADRFKLKVLRETRQLSGYALVVANNGPKLKQEQSTEESRLVFLDPNGGNGGKSAKRSAVQNLITLSAQKTSMAQLVQALSRGPAGGPVVDQTGLTGSYDFTLSWEPEESLSKVLQEQLGLKLEGQKVSVEFLTIEHAEKPSEN